MGFFLRIALELLVTALGLSSTIVGYLTPNSALIVGLGALTTIFASIVLAGDVKGHYEEREDFRKKIIDNAVRIVDSIIVSGAGTPISFQHLSDEVWKAKSEGLKKELLGESDYNLWGQFYDNVDERNHQLESSWINPATVSKLNRAIYSSFQTADNGISWVAKAIPRERIAEFQTRAQNSATL